MSEQDEGARDDMPCFVGIGGDCCLIHGGNGMTVCEVGLDAANAPLEPMASRRAGGWRGGGSQRGPSSTPRWAATTVIAALGSTSPAPSSSPSART